ncbi:MAG: TonB family protein [Candidatus Eisenbacteria bacterium]|nr:TonB family protein [Candidatus Eisenbacteria bacterium]
MPWPPIVTLALAAALAAAAPAPSSSPGLRPADRDPRADHVAAAAPLLGAAPATRPGAGPAARRAAGLIRRRALETWQADGLARLDSVKAGFQQALALDPALAGDDTVATFCRVFGIGLPRPTVPKGSAKPGGPGAVVSPQRDGGADQIIVEGLADPRAGERWLGSMISVQLATLPQSDYPRFLKREPSLDYVGRLGLRVLVDEAGRIARAATFSGGSLDPEIERALRQWEFQPCRIAGRPVPVRAMIAVGSDEPTPPPSPRRPPPSVAPPPRPPLEDRLPAFGEYVYAQELPEAITMVAPVYPQLAREAGVEGTVMVQALVGTDGRVKDMRVVKSIPMLDAPARDCVRQWVFKPALINGEPIAVWVAVPIQFPPR